MVISCAVTVDVCVCTFRRFHLALTLQSIASLSMSPELTVNVIVADNDDTPSAKDLIDKVCEDFPYPLTYIHAPARNISIARNACLIAATSTFIAFIDDDELASAEWLLCLIAQQKINDATVILGPVKAKYPETGPKWISKGDFLSVSPVWVKGKIVTGYTGNVMFKRLDPKIAGQTFDISKGRSGGEDTAFFGSISDRGASIEFAPGAVVMETVDPKRLSYRWLSRRFFRMGQTHADRMQINRAISMPSLARLAVMSLLKVGFCLFMTIVSLVCAGRTAFWSLRATFHLGVMARLFGQKELTQYG